MPCFLQCQLHRLLKAVSKVLPRLDRVDKAQTDYQEDAAKLAGQVGWPSQHRELCVRSVR